jgi:hypothetical protein
MNGLHQFAAQPRDVGRCAHRDQQCTQAKLKALARVCRAPITSVLVGSSRGRFVQIIRHDWRG